MILRGDWLAGVLQVYIPWGDLFAGVSYHREIESPGSHTQGRKYFNLLVSDLVAQICRLELWKNTWGQKSRWTVPLKNQFIVIPYYTYTQILNPSFLWSHNFLISKYLIPVFCDPIIFPHANTILNPSILWSHNFLSYKYWKFQYFVIT